MKLYIQERFAQIPNSLVNNKDVSLRAKWLYALMQSKSDWWEFSSDRLANESKEWVWAVKSALRELEEAWYLIRRKWRSDIGQWEWEHILLAIPNQPAVENPPTVNPPTVKPSTVNRPTNKERYNKKDITIKKEQYICSFIEKYPKQRLVSKSKVTEKLLKFDEDLLKIINDSLFLFLSHWEKEKTEVKYIPMAMTWLNQERWEIPPDNIKKVNPNSIYNNPCNV